MVGIYTNLMTKIGVLAIVRFIRSRPELAGTRIVLGGPEVTQHVEKFLEHGADVLVIGEGEETTHALASAWRDGGADAPLGEIAGIAFRDRSTGGVVRTEPRALLKSLDELPMPKREAVDLQSYLNAWRERHGSNAISVSTMRGCPYSCRWCSRAVYGQSYRRRSPKLVVDEIQLIVDRYHPAREQLPKLVGNRRAFGQATIRHAVFGAVLGLVEDALNDPIRVAEPEMGTSADQGKTTSPSNGLMP